MLDGAVIGVGEPHPQWVQKMNCRCRRVISNATFEALKRAELPQYAEVSRFPPVVRDLAIVVDQNVVLQTLLDGLSTHRQSLVQDIRLFDVYTGKGIESGKKSLAFRIVMQDTRIGSAEMGSCFPAFGTSSRAINRGSPGRTENRRRNPSSLLVVG
ncbi:MAG: hypothetical protein IPO00_06650 [Betaproteobacteria bacterium]|nr:hypothetical protein [Betaproteobacteria bacterium]